MSVERENLCHWVERYRPYLALLAQTHINPRQQAKIDASDIVQQTLLEAHERIEQFRGRTGDELAAWLRRILAHNLIDARRHIGAAKRDAAVEQSIEGAVDRSSLRLEGFLAADQSTPSQQAHRHERAVRLAAALAELPDAQRQALVLQHWHGWTLEQIARKLERTPAAVAGLLKRGLAHLRNRLQDLE